MSLIRTNLITVGILRAANVAPRKYYTLDGVDDYITIPEAVVAAGDSVSFRFIAPTEVLSSNAVVLDIRDRFNVVLRDNGSIRIPDAASTATLDGEPIEPDVTPYPTDGAVHEMVITFTDTDAIVGIGSNNGSSSFLALTIFNVEILAVAGNRFYPIGDDTDSTVLDTVGGMHGTLHNMNAENWSASLPIAPPPAFDEATLVIDSPLTGSGTYTNQDTVTLSVAVSGNGVKSFSWFKDGVPIDGVTGDTYTVPYEQGTFTISVTAISTADNVAILGAGSHTVTMRPFEYADVTLTAQPVGGNFHTQDTHTLSVGVSGSNYDVQWEESGSPINGATANTFPVPMVAGTYNYRAKVSRATQDDYDEVYTDTVAITIREYEEANVVITAHPQGGNVYTHEGITLSVTAIGDGLTYQWQESGSDVVGATSSSYVVPMNEGTYSYTVDVKSTTQDEWVEVTSDAAVVVVSEFTGAAPVVTQQPVGGTFHDRETITLTVAVGGNGTVTFQWFNSLGAIAGSEGLTSLVVPSDLGTESYFVRVTDDTGDDVATIDSITAVVTVRPYEDAVPVVTQHPVGGSFHDQQTIQLTAYGDGEGTVTTVWENTAGELGGTENQNTITVPSDIGTETYKMKVTDTTQDESNSVYSSDAVVTVRAYEAPSVVIDTQPVGGSITTDETITLSVVATVAGTATYQWKDSLGTPISGAVGSSYSVPVQTGSFDFYCSVTSTTLDDTLTVDTDTVTIEITEPVPEPTGTQRLTLDGVDDYLSIPDMTLVKYCRVEFKYIKRTYWDLAENNTFLWGSSSSGIRYDYRGIVQRYHGEGYVNDVHIAKSTLVADYPILEASTEERSFRFEVGGTADQTFSAIFSQANGNYVVRDIEVWDLKIYDENGVLIRHYPLDDGYRVDGQALDIVGGQHGTLMNVTEDAWKEV